MKIVVIANPLRLKHSVSLIDDNNQEVEQKAVSRDSLVTTIFTYAQHNVITDVLFKGNEKYVQRFIDKAKQEEVKRYSQNKINFQIIK